MMWADSPLAQPIHKDAAGPGDPPWRDNAYLAFWSSNTTMCGEMHISTSPNSEGRRLRLEVVIDHETFEVIEPLQPGTFRSASMNFDLSGFIEALSAALSAKLHFTPRFTACDYGPTGVLGGLVKGIPLRHYQQGVDVTGTITVRGRTHAFTGQGFRDRTWGFRDETAQWEQYAAVWACFDDFDFTWLKILGTDKQMRFAGFVLDAAGVHEIENATMTYDPSGLLARATMRIGGEDHALAIAQRITNGVWQPLGPEREGPQLSTYVEYPLLDAWGHRGRGLAGYGAVRRVW